MKPKMEPLDRAARQSIAAMAVLFVSGTGMTATAPLQGFAGRKTSKEC